MIIGIYRKAKDDELNTYLSKDLDDELISLEKAFLNS